MPALLTKSDADKLLTLLTQFLTPKGCYSVFLKYKLIKKNQYRLAFKINGSKGLTVKRLLQQEGLIKKSARGKVVAKKDLALLIAQLTPKETTESKEKLRVLNIWASLFRADQTVLQRMPVSLKDLSEIDEKNLWLLALQGNKKVLNGLTALYLPIIEIEANKINLARPLDERIRYGELGLFYAFFANLESDNYPIPEREDIIYWIKNSILNLGEIQ